MPQTRNLIHPQTLPPERSKLTAFRSVLLTGLLAAGCAILFSRSSWPFLAVTAVSLTCVLILYVAHKVVPALGSPHGFALLLWTLLVAHRAFIPRVESLQGGNLEWGPIVIAEVSLTISIFISCLVLFLVSFRRNRSGGAPITVKLIFLYAIMAGLSLTYTPAPFYAGFYFLRLLSAVFLLAVYFGSVNDSQVARFAGCTCLAVTPYMLFPWIELITRQAVTDHRLSGFYLHPITASTIGYTVAILCFFSWLENRRSIAPLGLGLLGLSSAYLGGGKAPAAAMAAVLLLVFIANWRKIFSARSVAAILLACVVLTPLAMSGDVGLLAHWEQYSAGQDFGSLTSRVELWRVAIPIWSKAPILGYGFSSIPIMGIFVPNAEWTAGHAHNSYLEALLEVGLLGSLPLFFAIGIVLLRTLRLRFQAFRLKPLAPIAAALYFLLLCSVTDVVFGCPVTPPVYLFFGLLVCADVLTQWRGDPPAPEEP
jgi:O-antigen ligase